MLDGIGELLVCGWYVFVVVCDIDWFDVMFCVEVVVCVYDVVV